jgi:hypothetical protein
MEILVPMQLYGFDFIAYLIAAITCLVITFYSFKLYKMTDSKKHFKLLAGFFALSLGFLLISAISGYAYIVFLSCIESCPYDILKPVFDVAYIGYIVYYVLSLAAYFSFVLMYLPDKVRFPQIFLLPLSLGMAKMFPYFHLLALFMLAFIVFRTAQNYAKRKSRYNLLVTIAFSLLFVYHLLLLLIPLNENLYIAAHLSLLLSYMTLFFMIYQVRRK